MPKGKSTTNIERIGCGVELTERYAGRPSAPIRSFGRSRETKRTEVPSESGTVVLYARDIVDQLARPQPMGRQVSATHNMERNTSLDASKISFQDEV